MPTPARPSCSSLPNLYAHWKSGVVVGIGTRWRTLRLGKAHLAMRKEIVDHQQLRAVISMPSGVFKPYAGVSTAVLVFTKTNSGGTDKVWFYDMKADGYSLDDKRSPISDNDIPDVVARFRHLEADQNGAARSRASLFR